MTALGAQALAFVRRFLHWWGSELLGLLPAAFSRLYTKTDRVVLQLEDGAATLVLEASRGSIPLGTIALHDVTGSKQEVQNLLQRRGLTNRLARDGMALRLRLPSQSALRTTIELPAAAASNLREVVSFELDRHTPFHASQASVGCRLIGLDRSAGTLTVAITVVPRHIVENAIKLAAGLVLRPDEVDVAAPEANGEPSPELVFDEVLPRPASRGNKLAWGLATLSLLLAAVAVSIPILAARREAADLTAKFAVVKERTTARALAQRNLDALHAEQTFLIARKREMPTVSQILLDTTHILPDDTFLTEFHVTGAEVQMTGLASSASSLIDLLERSKVFRDTAFRSPVTQDTRSGRERFLIATRVIPESGR